MAEAASDTFCPPARRRYVLFAAILASSMAFIDGAVLSIAVPALRADLGATLADAQWISNAYLLFLSALLLLGGAAGDRFGLQRVFGLGIIVFTLASLACTLAPNALWLILARAVQGLGAAFMVPGSLAIIAKAYPRAERGRAIGIWASASSLTTLIGPVLGGLVLSALGDASWRLVFAINLPLGAAALALLWLKVPADKPAPGKRIDSIGAVLASLALMLIAFGLTGGSSESVPSPGHVALYGGLGLVTLVAFGLWEWRAAAPMLPMRLFANVRFAGANALTLALYFGLGGVMFFLPMTMIAGWGTAPAVVAVALLPLGAAITLLSSTSGALADRFGPAPLIASGASIVAIAFAGMGLTAPLQAVWTGVFPLMCLMGLGMALVVSPLSTAVMTSVADADTGTASGVNNAVARLAGLLAVALMGILAAVVFDRTLGETGAGLFFGLPPETALDPAVEAARQRATDTAFAAVAYANAALSLLAAVIAWITLRGRGNVSAAGPVAAPGA